MSSTFLTRPDRDASQLRALVNEVFARVAGAPLVPGNHIRLLKDAANYAAWLDAIRCAKSTIHFESYIIHADDTGRQFVELLAAKAREGVRVRVIYDWMGALATRSGRLWRTLRAAGAEIRCFNRPRLDDPFGWLSRDHRKMISVDGQIAFVSGLCVGHRWLGYPLRGVAPWRDTGVEITGPVVADLERAFGGMWARLRSGADSIPEQIETVPASSRPDVVSLGIVTTSPNTAGIYRLDQLIAAVARRSIWLTDAYFVGTPAYVGALKAAAEDGVDVRLLIPRATDIPAIRWLAHAGLSGLLQAGVRVFEWNGPMLHAKTAVADSRWSRVGSSNLNLASWFGNWELDVVVDDQEFARMMEEMYLDDLGHSTELLLSGKHRLRSSSGRQRRHDRTPSQGSVAITSLLRVGTSVSAAITNHQTLDPDDATLMTVVALLLLAAAVFIVLFPWIAAAPVVVWAMWIGVSILIRACRRRSRRRKYLTNGKTEFH